MDSQNENKKKSPWWLEALIVVIILALSLLCYFLFFHSSQEGSSLRIEAGNRVIAEYPLDSDKLILIEKQGSRYSVSEISEPYSTSDFNENYNLISISNGSVRVIEADCPARGSTRCTNQGARSHSGESIICLEHNLVITVLGGEEGELDLVSK